LAPATTVPAPWVRSAIARRTGVFYLDSLTRSSIPACHVEL